MSATEVYRPHHETANRIFTAHDLENMPSEDRLELIRGELCPMPNNSAEHGQKTMMLSILVGVYVLEHDLGECFAAETRFTIEESPDTTLAPDFAFVSKSRIESIPPKGYLKLAPDLVVETRSPGDRQTEFALKIDRWLRAGCRLVWALDPKTRSVTVHKAGAPPVTLAAGATLDGEDVLPGFALPLNRVFQRD